MEAIEDMWQPNVPTCRVIGEDELLHDLSRGTIRREDEADDFGASER